MSDCIELTVTACKQNTSIVVVAASHLMFAIARDGVLPLLGWISQVDKDGQPRHAVTVIFVVAALLLYSILPNTVAFTSLISAGGLLLKELNSVSAQCFSEKTTILILNT